MTFNGFYLFSFATAPVAELIISMTGMKSKDKHCNTSGINITLFHLTPCIAASVMHSCAMGINCSNPLA